MTPVFPLQNQRMVLMIPAIFFSSAPYGAITLYRAPFQETSGMKIKKCADQYSTSRYLFSNDSVCSIPLSIAFTNGILFWYLFFRLLRCFNSADSHLQIANAGRNRREVALGNPGFKGCIRLPRAYRSLLRPSSAFRTKPSTIRRGV